MTNHLWQSTLFAMLAALLTLALRKNRAQVRYWLWFSASIKFFVPFSLLISLGSHLGWAPAARKITTQIAAPAVSLTMVQITQPFPNTLPPAPSTPNQRDWIPIAIWGVWAGGLAGVALIRFRGWLRIRAAVRASISMDIPASVAVRSSPGLLEPGVVGLWRPILLLPAGIADRLTPPQLDAVLAHELCHVRRRDNLFASIQMIVEATFWFHPLVWWIGARLVEERERACDEEVLRLGSEPQVYAAGIVNICKLYVESPLSCVSGVTGSNLKKRIEAIMTNRIAVRLNFARKAALAAAGVAALAAPIVVGILNAPFIRAQPAPAGTPKFVGVSILTCTDANIPSGGGRGGRAGLDVIPVNVDSTGNFQIPDRLSPARLNVNCQTLDGLIQAAYILFADGHLDLSRIVPIEGDAAWINSARYTISATPEGTPSRDIMMGPMLQALLEDRFKLKVHRETREVPVYELTVAEGGLKLPPFQEGSCTPVHFTQFFEAVARVKYSGQAFEPMFSPGVDYCPNRGGGTESINTVDAQGTSLDEFSRIFLRVLDRPVINKTGVAGLFNFHLEYAVDETTSGGRPRSAPVGDSAGGPSIFTALREQLGLKLDPSTALRDSLVIDHIERP